MAGRDDSQDAGREADGPSEAARLLTPAEAMAVPATGDPRWRGRAACNSGEHDPELWWPHPSQEAVEARVICAGCPVLGDCRDAYLNSDNPGDRDGIWAGVRGHDLLAAARTRRAGCPSPLIGPTRARPESVDPQPPADRDEWSR